jgi:hypothetical protein
MPMLDLPHKDSSDCIRALEAEVAHLRRLLAQLKPVVLSHEEESQKGSRLRSLAAVLSSER